MLFKEERRVVLGEGVREEGTELLRRVAIGLGQEVRVHIQRRRRVSVAEPPGHCSDIDATAEQARRDIVTQVVKPYTVDARTLTQPAEASARGIREPRC